LRPPGHDVAPFDDRANALFAGAKVLDCAAHHTVKVKMNIKDFERVTGVPRTAIRHYESLGILSPMHIDARSGYRSYGPKEIERVKTIRAAQALGFSLANAAELIQDWNKGAFDSAAQRRAIEQRYAEALARRKEMDRLLKYLNRILKWIDGGAQGPKPDFAAGPRRR
jgi:DNA-binding transcriptional MerR regulator